MILSVALSPAIDVTYVVDELVEGTHRRPISVHKVAGGKAINMARAAASVGARVSVLSILGGTSGAFIRDELENAQIPHVSIRQQNETRTCISIFSSTSRQLTEIYEAPSALDDDSGVRLVDAFRGALADEPTWVSFSGSLPDSLSPDTIGELGALARAAGALIAVDTHGRALEAAVVARPSLVKVNRAEAAELLGTPSDGRLLEMAVAIRAMTGGAVVLTDGRAGSIGISGDGMYRARFDGAAGAFSVGSGDSFLGGLLAALDRGASFPDALSLATACGVANTFEPGSARMARDAVENASASVLVTRLD